MKPYSRNHNQNSIVKSKLKKREVKTKVKNQTQKNQIKTPK